MITCRECGRKEVHCAKGLCMSCYQKSRKRKPLTPEQLEKRRESARKYSMKRYVINMKINPRWNAIRQKQYRKEHPEMFNKAMCRCFMKKIGKKVTLDLVKELFGV